ncbi:MAG: succinate dehydrogenase assembly factor 2 [Gammaproteobacteria bacterium]
MTDPNESPADKARRLAWQCRRGIKEVEVVLVPFFEQHFQQLSPEDQLLFERFLEEHDVDMFEWFTKRHLAGTAGSGPYCQHGAVRCGRLI